MGEAKRRSLQQTKCADKLHALNLDQMSNAVQKLATTSSRSYSADCFMHARLCQALLQAFDVDMELIIGFAGWRVGNGDGDTVLHAPPVQGIKEYQLLNYECLQGENAVPYHAWLEYGGQWILDFTTYQLPDKARKLDEMDGRHTQVDWHPNYLLTDKKSISTISDVIQKHTGLFWYQRDLNLESYLKDRAYPLDDDDLALLKLIYKNPDMKVVGLFGESH